MAWRNKTEGKAVTLTFYAKDAADLTKQIGERCQELGFAVGDVIVRRGEVRGQVHEWSVLAQKQEVKGDE